MTSNSGNAMYCMYQDISIIKTDLNPKSMELMPPLPISHSGAYNVSTFERLIFNNIIYLTIDNIILLIL